MTLTGFVLLVGSIAMFVPIAIVYGPVIIERAEAALKGGK